MTDKTINYAEKKMSDNASNPNVEWKKGSIGEQEKLTLKVNVKKAVEYNAQKDSVFKSPAAMSANLPQGLKRIRNKIKNFDDDEDEDDNGQLVIDPLAQQGNSLLSALHDDEKKMLKQQETNSIIQQQLDVEKVNTIAVANNMAKQAGFNGLKKETIQQGLMDNSINPNKLKQTIQKDFSKEVKATKKDWSELSDNDLLNLMEGVNKIKSIGGKKNASMLKEMDIKEVIDIGREKNNDMDVAHTICEKTGRKDKKATPKEQQKTEKKMVKEQKVNRKLIQDRERN